MKGKKNGCGNHKKSCADPVNCADHTCVLSFYYGSAKTKTNTEREK